MLLKNNVIIPEAKQQPPEVKAGPELQIRVEALANSVPGLGVVYVVNASSNVMTSLTVDGVTISPPPPPSNPGQPPQSVAVNRFGSPPLFSTQTELEVCFVDGSSYAQTVEISEPPAADLTLWCFYNGFVLTGPYGTISQLSWD